MQLQCRPELRGHASPSQSSRLPLIRGKASEENIVRAVDSGDQGKPNAVSNHRAILPDNNVVKA
ncbi:MAG: hypothetical protein WA655_14330, partial [Candidatus Korobacteraceae bacterium]